MLRELKTLSTQPDSPTKKKYIPKGQYKDFDDFYEQTCKAYLEQKKSKLEALQKEKMDKEAGPSNFRPQIKHVPTSLDNLPFHERIKLKVAKRNQQLEQLRKEMEELREKKETEELTFKPKIYSKNSKSHFTLGNELLKNPPDLKCLKLPEPEVSDKEDEEGLYRPKIDKNSEKIAVYILGFLILIP